MTSNAWTVAALAVISLSVVACDDHISPAARVRQAPLTHTSRKVTLNGLTMWSETITPINSSVSETVILHFENVTGSQKVPFAIVIINDKDFPAHLTSFQVCQHKISDCSTASLGPDEKWVVQDVNGQINPFATKQVRDILARPMKLYQQYQQIHSVQEKRRQL